MFGKFFLLFVLCFFNLNIYADYDYEVGNLESEFDYILNQKGTEINMCKVNIKENTLYDQPGCYKGLFLYNKTKYAYEQIIVLIEQVLQQKYNLNLNKFKHIGLIPIKKLDDAEFNSYRNKIGYINLDLYLSLLIVLDYYGLNTDEFNFALEYVNNNSKYNILIRTDPIAGFEEGKFSKDDVCYTNFTSDCYRSYLYDNYKKFDSLVSTTKERILLKYNKKVLSFSNENNYFVNYPRDLYDDSDNILKYLIYINQKYLPKNSYEMVTLWYIMDYLNAVSDTLNIRSHDLSSYDVSVIFDDDNIIFTKK